MSFWGELKRRNVYKVGVAYAIVAWLLIQAASIIFPHLNLPSWATTFVIVILIIGFPIAILLAWAYEVTPEGIKRTKEVPLPESITHLTGQKLNYIVTALLVVAVAFLVFKVYFSDQHAHEQKVVSTKTEQTPAVSEAVKTKKTIAVLPFTDLSPEKDQEYFVDGLSEELLNSLTKVPELLVTARTSSFAFKGTNKKVQEVAAELGVAHVLEGSVRKAGDALRITVQLIRASDGFHLWSETYDRELKDIFAVQEDIATTVADELKATLGIDSTAIMVGGTDNLKSYELYLVAQGQRYGDTYEAFSDALESLDAAIALDPGFALAWAKKAYMHIYRLITGPSKRDATEGNFALEAAQRAIELEPDLAEAHIALGWVKAWQGNLIEAEDQYRKALELRDDFLTGDDEYITVLYNSVCYFDRAFELFGKILRNDRLNPFIRGHYMVNLALRGDTKSAEEEYTRCRAAFGDLGWHNYVIMNIRLGAGKVLTRDDIVISDPIYDAAKKHLDSPENAIAALRQLYSDADNLNYHNLSSIASLAAYFEDPEFALDVYENTGGANFYIWLPAYVKVRQLPRFKEFVKKIGLVDYWNEFGWPDLCRPLDNGDFVCD